MNKFLILLAVVLPFCFGAQILERYPSGQDDYVGGNAQFYEDFHTIVKEKNMQPCINKDEVYLFRIVVYPDSTIKYVKDEDPTYAEKNKCTFDLARNVAKYMKGWKPATENGKKVAALTSFWVIPDDLFDHYKKGYDASNLFTAAEFKGGLNEFRRKVVNKINLSGFSANQKFSLLVTFVVNPDGKMEDVTLVESTSNEEFNQTILAAIRSIKEPWIPAKIRNKPVRYHYKLPLAFQF